MLDCHADATLYPYRRIPSVACGPNQLHPKEVHLQVISAHELTLWLVLLFHALCPAGASENLDVFAAAAALAEDKALAADVLSVEFVPQVREHIAAAVLFPHSVVLLHSVPLTHTP